MCKPIWLSCILAWLTLSAAVADPMPSGPPPSNGQAASSSNAGAIKTFQFGAAREMENRVTQASRVGDTVYVAGQFSPDKAGTFVGEGDVAAQTRQTLANLDQVLAGLGASKPGIIELEVFLIDPGKNLQSFNQEYRRYVGSGRLTVTLIGVTALAYPQELVEIRAVAHATH